MTRDIHISTTKRDAACEKKANGNYGKIGRPPSPRTPSVLFSKLLLVYVRLKTDVGQSAKCLELGEQTGFASTGGVWIV